MKSAIMASSKTDHVKSVKRSGTTTFISETAAAHPRSELQNIYFKIIIMIIIIIGNGDRFPKSSPPEKPPQPESSSA
jgi:hypothetical protein